MYTVHRAAGFGLLLSFCTFAFANPAITANCGSIVTSGDLSANCSSFTGTPGVGGVSASGQALLSLASDAANYSVLTTGQSVFATESFPLPNQGLGSGSGGSTSTIAYLSALTTVGPQRDGYLQISPSSYATIERPYDSSGGGISFGLDITPFNGYYAEGPFTSIQCGGYQGCTPGSTYYTSYYPLIPVTLGTVFNAFANGSINTYVNRGDGQSGGSIDSTFQFRFFEADGTTPVQVAAAAPEPGTIGMLGGGLLFAALYSRWRVKARQM